jgi:hypothetical protein
MSKYKKKKVHNNKWKCKIIWTCKKCNEFGHVSVILHSAYMIIYIYIHNSTGKTSDTYPLGSYLFLSFNVKAYLFLLTSLRDLHVVFRLTIMLTLCLYDV